MSSTRLGLVRCEHCNRQFNPHSAARHIPWCAKRQGENRKHRLSADKLEALERYKWRISYRPSNYPQKQPTPMGGVAINTNTNTTTTNGLHYRQRGNKSSLNTTPSASSSSSIGTSVTSSIGETQQQKHHHHHHHHQANGSSVNGSSRIHRASSSSKPLVGQLRRSHSTLTITKPRGSLNLAADQHQHQRKPLTDHQREDAQSLTSSCSAPHKRTKSVSDLNSMSEIVGVLAQRMEEIYAQNKILLASLSGAKSAAANIPNKLGRYSHKDGSDGGEDSEFTSPDLLVKCHHCKSLCLDGANYCHRCGCKVRPSASISGGAVGGAGLAGASGRSEHDSDDDGSPTTSPEVARGR